MTEPAVRAFFGLGAMGYPIARHMAGQATLAAHDPDAERIAKLRAAVAPDAITVGEAHSETARTVFLCLPDQATTRQIIEQLLGIGVPDRRIIDFGAQSPEFASEMAELSRAAGAWYCDAPVFGTPVMAERGELYFLFSGEDRIAAEFAQIAQGLNFKMRYAGPAGTASAIKLLQNALGTVNLAIGAEALLLCGKIGIDKQVFIDVVRECGGIGLSRVFDRYAEDMANGADSGEGRLRIAAKDMQSAARIARSCGVSAPILTTAAGQFAKAIDAGLGDRQFTSIVDLPETCTGNPETKSGS